jgi:hypothetical protein
MNAYIETVDGKVTLKVFHDPAVCNCDEAIAAGLASYGLRQGQAAVLAFPFPHPDDDSVFYKGKTEEPTL